MRPVHHLFAIVGLVWGCQPDGLTPLHLNANLEVTPAALEFGDLPLGTNSTLDVKLTNRGPLALQVTVSTQSATPGRFTVVPQRIELGAGQTSTLAVAFVPAEPVESSAVLRIEDPDFPEVASSVRLEGRAHIPDCEDHNPCTEDYFDHDAGSCQHVSHSGVCDDGLRCTEGDSCFRGVCVGEPLVCDDGVACTVDSCDEATGCTNLADHRLCSSGDLCTVGTCRAEQGCVAEPAPDGTPCGETDCQEMAICVSGECRRGPTPDGHPCDDGDPCAEGDRCRGGSCRPGLEAVADGTLCSEISCDSVSLCIAGQCSFLDQAPDGMPCDDGDPCSLNDWCQGGLCVAGEGSGQLISTPIEFDPRRVDDGNLPAQPVAVLAVNTLVGGGIDVVWLERSDRFDDEFLVRLTRVTVDGVVIGNATLARASRARALFKDHALWLLVAGCTDCVVLPDCGACTVEPSPCSTMLVRKGSDIEAPSVSLSICLDEPDYSPPTEIALAVDDTAIYVARDRTTIASRGSIPDDLLVERLPIPPSAVARRQLFVESWSNRPRALGLTYPRDLQLSPDGSHLTYQRLEELEYDWGCNYCTANDINFGQYCHTPTPVSVAAGPLLFDALPDVVGDSVQIAVPTRTVLQSPQVPVSLLIHSEQYLASGGADGPQCEARELLTGATGIDCMSRNHGCATLLLSAPANWITSVAATTLQGETAALVLTQEHTLELIDADRGETPRRTSVPHPISSAPGESRRFASSTTLFREAPLLATTPLGDGMVAVGITETNYMGGLDSEGIRADELYPYPDRLAFFRVGCASLPVDSPERGQAE